jgi:predicted amidohydrolase
VVAARHAAFPVEALEVGINRGRGNLLGLQPWVTPADYRSRETFEVAIRALLAAAHARGFVVKRKTIAVLPEYVGTWLALIDEPAPACWNLHSALSMSMVLANRRRRIAAAVNEARIVGSRDRLKHAIFAMKSEAMAAVYHDVFSSLAREYEITLVGGSIVLADPAIERARLVVRTGHLYNSTVVYRPDGSPYPRLTRKAFPVQSERGFTTPGELNDQGIYETEGGVLFKALNCADAWFPQSYAGLAAAGVEAVVVFSYLVKTQAWKKPWRGHADEDPRFAPPGVDWSRRGSISEEEAWDRWGPLARLPGDVPQVLKVVLRGKLWEIGAEGTTTLINRRADGQPKKIPYRSDRPYLGLACSWL